MPSRSASPAPQPEPDDGLPLSIELRKVLYSPQKTEILCLFEDGGPAEAAELVDKLTVPIKRNNVTLHLKELEDYGYIEVVERRQNRGGFAKVFDLVDRTVSWREFIADLKRDAPRRITPSAGDPAQ